LRRSSHRLFYNKFVLFFSILFRSTLTILGHPQSTFLWALELSSPQLTSLVALVYSFEIVHRSVSFQFCSDSEPLSRSLLPRDCSLWPTFSFLSCSSIQNPIKPTSNISTKQEDFTANDGVRRLLMSFPSLALLSISNPSIVFFSGDAPIRTIATALFLPRRAFHDFSPITGYQHEYPSFVCPEKEWCDCQP